MTLLYMYFENSSAIDGTYKGIKPNTNGYTFDNRFIVTLDKENNIFYISFAKCKSISVVSFFASLSLNISQNLLSSIFSSSVI